MWDLAEDENSIKLIESFLAVGKTFALVCHAPGTLRHVKTPDGKPWVPGKTVTGFTNGEEEEVGLTKVAPFLVEDELMSLGATFSKVKNWGVHTVADGQLITGQNPAFGPGCQASDRYAEQEGQVARLQPVCSTLARAAELFGAQDGHASINALDAFLSSDQSQPDSAALIFDSGPRVIAKTPLDDPQTASPPTASSAQNRSWRTRPCATPCQKRIATCASRHDFSTAMRRRRYS